VNLEDLARNAADDANAAGRSMPIVPLERSRRRRVLLTVVPTIAAGALAWVVIALVAFPQNVEPPVITEVPTTTTTVTETTTTTIATTATTIAATDIEPGWVRSSFTSTIDDSGELLSQYTAGINFGRTVAWDRTTRRGIVVVTEESLEWHQPGGITGHANIELGQIVTVEATPTGPVVALRTDDGSIIWYDLATGAETSPPVEPVTTDGITYTVGVRTATIDQPDWSDVPTGEGGEPIGEFDLPELVITEDGSEVLRMTVGSTDRPYIRIDAFDGRRVIVVAEPYEPALPPMTAWIIDLECPDCTERIETQGAEWFDLTGFLVSEGAVAAPDLPAPTTTETTTTTVAAGDTQTPVDMSDPESVGRAFLQAWAAGDSEAMRELLTPSYEEFYDYWPVDSGPPEGIDVNCDFGIQLECDVIEPSTGEMWFVLMEAVGDEYRVWWLMITNVGEGGNPDPVDSDAEAGLRWDIGIIVSIDVDSDGQVRMDYDRVALCNGCSSLDLTERPMAIVGNTDMPYLNENRRLRNYPVSESVEVTVISPEWLETSCALWSGGPDAGEPIWEAASVDTLLSRLQSSDRIHQTALTFDADGIVTAIQVGGGC
jgi:hypothetical protein